MIDECPNYTEPFLREIHTHKVFTQDFDYWPDIKGELLYRVNCSDGIVFIYYIPCDTLPNNEKPR